MRNKTLQVAQTHEFIYKPPTSAFKAQRILVKPNLGYPVPPPVTVSLKVLDAVLQGLRQANPSAEILIVEGVCSPVPLQEIIQRHGLSSILGEGMRVWDADSLPLAEYPNLSPQPIRFKSMFAPALLQQVDCRISVGTLKRTHLKGEPLISASLKNLYGLFPRTKYKARSPHSRGQLHRPSVPLILQDVYFCIGHLFDGAVVDGDRKLISADWKPKRDLPAFDTVKKIYLDIETTGLDLTQDRVIMVGLKAVGYPKLKDTYKIITDQDEKVILEECVKTLSKQQPEILIGYNNRQFDIPFLVERCEKLGIKHNFKTTDYTVRVKTALPHCEPISFNLKKILNINY